MSNTREEDLRFLGRGELEVLGRIVAASNATLLCQITDADRTQLCVYKPISGEQPLWDFPDGTLADREVASFAVSEATGWGLIPPTILRDGPFGDGMIQLWQDGDDHVDLIELINAKPHSLRRMSLLDAVINNSDRKGGHLIPHPEPVPPPLADYQVWGVDHGVTFSVDDKLRTVLWQWAGLPIPDDELATLRDLREQLDGALGDELHAHLTNNEVRRTAQRLEELIESGRHPMPSSDWPSVPYPPF